MNSTDNNYNEQLYPINNKTILLLIGMILILFATVYIFTRNAFYNEFDLSKSGAIGDTIGGITAPVINLIGAILVYLSFQAQIKANKIQFKFISDEVKSRENERNYELTIELFKQFKEDVSKLKYENKEDSEALELFSYRISVIKTKDGLTHLARNNFYLNILFLLNEYSQILSQIEKKKMMFDEKKTIFMLVFTFYNTKLNMSCSTMHNVFEKVDKEINVNKLIVNIDKTNMRLAEILLLR